MKFTDDFNELSSQVNSLKVSTSTTAISTEDQARIVVAASAVSSGFTKSFTTDQIITLGSNLSKLSLLSSTVTSLTDTQAYALASLCAIWTEARLGKMTVDEVSVQEGIVTQDDPLAPFTILNFSEVKTLITDKKDLTTIPPFNPVEWEEVDVSDRTPRSQTDIQFILDAIRASTYSLVQGVLTYQDTNAETELKTQVNDPILSGETVPISTTYNILLQYAGLSEDAVTINMQFALADLLDMARTSTNTTQLMSKMRALGYSSTSLNWVLDINYDKTVSAVVINADPVNQTAVLTRLAQLAKSTNYVDESTYSTYYDNFISLFPNGMDDIYARGLATITGAVNINTQQGGNIQKDWLIQLVNDSYGIIDTEWAFVFSGISPGLQELTTPALPLGTVMATQQLTTSDIITLAGIGVTLGVAFYYKKGNFTSFATVVREVKTIILDTTIAGVVSIFLVETAIIYSKTGSIGATIGTEIADLILVLINALGTVISTLWNAIKGQVTTIALALASVGTAIATGEAVLGSDILGAGAAVEAGEDAVASAEIAEGGEIAGGEVAEGAEEEAGEIVEGFESAF